MCPISGRARYNADRADGRSCERHWIGRKEARVHFGQFRGDICGRNALKSHFKDSFMGSEIHLNDDTFVGVFMV